MTSLFGVSSARPAGAEPSLVLTPVPTLESLSARIDHVVSKADQLAILAERLSGKVERLEQDGLSREARLQLAGTDLSNLKHMSSTLAHELSLLGQRIAATEKAAEAAQDELAKRRDEE